MARSKSLTLIGIKETTDALKKFDKAAVNRFNKLIRTELESARVEAIASIPMKPMSGWVEESFGPQPERVAGKVPKWNVTKARAGIKSTRKEGKVRGDFTTSAGALTQADAAGAIFEVAGRKGGGQGHGVQFIANLNRFHRASRAIWSAVDKQGENIQRKVAAELNDLKRQLQNHLDKNK